VGCLTHAESWRCIAAVIAVSTYGDAPGRFSPYSGGAEPETLFVTFSPQEFDYSH
jgi:hypothetical protein